MGDSRPRDSRGGPTPAGAVVCSPGARPAFRGTRRGPETATAPGKAPVQTDGFEFLAKPFGLAELEERVRKVLDA